MGLHHLGRIDGAAECLLIDEAELQACLLEREIVFQRGVRNSWSLVRPLIDSLHSVN
jgi:hypothetical protein